MTRCSRLQEALVRILDWFIPAQWRDSIQGDLEEERNDRGRAAGPPPAAVLGILARFAVRRFSTHALTAYVSRLSSGLTRFALDARRDAGYAIRLTRQRPLVGTIAAGSLAVALGAGLAGLSIVDGVLLRPVRGVMAPERLVAVFGGTRERPLGALSFPDFRDYQTANAPVQGLTAFVSTEATVGAPPATERVVVQVVTDNFFDVLGIRPVLGRGFRRGESEPGSDPTVVVSRRLWDRVLGSSSGALGATLRVNDRLFHVIGVAPRQFRGVRLEQVPDVWVTTAHTGHLLPQWPADVLSRRHWAVWSVVGRLRDGATRQSAAVALAVFAAELDRRDPTLAPRTPSVIGVRDAALDPAGREAVATYAILLLAVLALLLVAASLNAATLLLARGVARRRELGVRMAIGATRAAVVRQLTCEGLLLAIVASAAGLLLAFWLMPVTAAIELPVPLIVGVSFDGRLAVAAILLFVLTGMACSVWPAVGLSRPGLLPQGTQQDDVVPRGGYRLGLRRALLAAQVAVSVVLLVSAGLLVRTLRALQAVDPGFAAAAVAAVRIDPERAGLSADAATPLYLDLAERVSGQPAVSHVALSSYLPLHAHSSSMEVFADDETAHVVKFNLVGRDYFSTLRIRLAEGRFLENRDWTHGSVIVVSQAMADRFWPDGSAVGRFVTTRRGGPRWEVVGVAGDVKYETLRESRAPLMYIPFPRVPKMFSSGMYLTARAGPGGPNPLAVMRQALRDGQAPPIVGELDLGDELSRAVAPERQSAMVLSAFATLAFVLAVIGVYGLSAFNVARRSRELSVRIAMGATTAGLAGLVLRESLAFVGLGLGLGLAAALVLGQVLSARLYGVPVSDPVTLATVAIAVMLAAVAATVPPAVRATHVDVVTFLRRD